MKSSLHQFAVTEKTIDLHRQLANAELKIQEHRRNELNLEKLITEYEKRISLLEKIDCIIPSTPDRAKYIKNPKTTIHIGTPTLLLSDAHWDEVIDPDEVEGVNKYTREIAIKRLAKIREDVIKVSRTYYAGIKYEGFSLMIGGDMLSGNIHEELEETNEDTVIGSVDFWIDHLVAFIISLADEYKRVHVSGVVGNHGRNTRKPRAKLRVRDNFDWFLYRQAARILKSDKRVTFQIPESADREVKVYETTYRLTHGDQFHGGSGIAGMMSPLMLGHHRKAIRQMSIGKPYNWLVMGHWHEYWMGKGIIVNGSIKGYDEYAYVCNFPANRAIQAFWISTPEHGPTFPAPIFCDNRANEGW